MTGHVSYRWMIVHLNQWTYGLVCHKEILGPMLRLLSASSSPFLDWFISIRWRYYNLHQLQRCAQELNSTLNTVSSWSNDSRLELNQQKTRTMLLSTSQMFHVRSLYKNRPEITISDNTLKYVNVSQSFLVSIFSSILIRISSCEQRTRAVKEQYK